MEVARPLIQLLVLIAGFANAGAIAWQAIRLIRIKKSEGISVFMFLVFLFIQISLTLNGLLHHDFWQILGMLASMLTTLWTIGLIYHYRRIR